MKHGRISKNIVIDELDGRCKVYPEYTHRLTVNGYGIASKFHKWFIKEFGSIHGSYSHCCNNKKQKLTTVNRRFLFRMKTYSEFIYYINEEDAMLITLLKANGN